MTGHPCGKDEWDCEYPRCSCEFPFLIPCPICKGVEGCDHTVMERARAASAVLGESAEQKEGK